MFNQNTFLLFQVDHSYSHDFVRVYDENSYRDSSLLAEVSGFYWSGFSILPSNISSSSNELLITFTSDEWYVGTGFRAYIHVDIKHDSLVGDACSMTRPCKENQGHCQSDDECKGYLKCGHNNCPDNLGYHLLVTSQVTVTS